MLAIHGRATARFNVSETWFAHGSEADSPVLRRLAPHGLRGGPRRRRRKENGVERGGRACSRRSDLGRLVVVGVACRVVVLVLGCPALPLFVPGPRAAEASRRARACVCVPW